MNKQYQVKIRHDNSKTYLQVTHNGYQWSSTEIKDRINEIPILIKELEYHLKVLNIIKMKQLKPELF